MHARICRKGFVKLALREGASLVPVFSFGENAVFEMVKSREGTVEADNRSHMH